MTKLIEEEWLKEEHQHKLKHMFIHSIRVDKLMCDLTVASKMKTDWPFLTRLRDLGREAAAQWLDQHIDKIGKESTVDLHSEFLDIGSQHIG